MFDPQGSQDPEVENHCPRPNVSLITTTKHLVEGFLLDLWTGLLCWTMVKVDMSDTTYITHSMANSTCRPTGRCYPFLISTGTRMKSWQETGQQVSTELGVLKPTLTSLCCSHCEVSSTPQDLPHCLLMTWHIHLTEGNQPSARSIKERCGQELTAGSGNPEEPRVCT